MNMKNERPQHRGAQPLRMAFTAAALAMLAGAPAGLAQNSAAEESGESGLGSLMGFLSSGGKTAQPNQATGPGNAQADEDEFRTEGVYYDPNMTVELHVQDEELTNVLQMLSLQSERNIVASNEVAARVTANLYGVTFHEALDAILHVNGYGYIEKGNFIYVYPAEVLEQIEQASRQVEGRVFTLNFISAVDAADLVAPLLSEVGEIKTNGQAPAWTDPVGPVGNEEFASLSTLIVYDFPSNIEAIEDMISALDVRPAQILVESTIVQTTLNEANAFGVDFSILADFDYADFASPLSAVDSLVRGTDGSERVPADGGATAVVGTPGDISGPGTFKAGIVSNDVSVFVRMLQEVTSTTIISNPKVVTLNRQPGRVLVGRKVGYLQTTATDTSTTQSVEFLDTGTQLNFRPFVTGEGIIRMELKPQVSEASLRSATDAVGAAVTIPDEITNELVANVMVPDGHTIVLGGLFREATTTTRRQVPVLGDIPLLGTAFRGHDDDIQRQEIIFMITPSIVSDQVLVDQGLRGEAAVERVRAGAREQTLPFSQNRQAAQLLVEAEHLAADGKTNKALHRVRRALELVPNYEDAIELRERLVNERDIWPDDSVLNDIIRDDAEAVRHNILEHGWWGDQSDAGNGSDGPTRHASNEDAAETTYVEPVEIDATEFAAVEPTETSSTDAFSQNSNVSNGFGDSFTLATAPDNGQWWTSPEFDVFMLYWSVSGAIEEGREFNTDERWWVSPEFLTVAESFAEAGPQTSHGEWLTSPEFDAFMTEWSTEFGGEQDGRWWTTPQFLAFAEAFADSDLGALDPQWLASDEFNQLMSAWSSALAHEQGLIWDPTNNWWQTEQFRAFATAFLPSQDGPETATADGAGDGWWATPEFQQFLQNWNTETAAGDAASTDFSAWYGNEEFRVFMRAFDRAVNDSRLSAEPSGTTTGTTTGTTLTEVPTDSQK